MDSTKLFNKIINRKNLELAFDLAIKDKINTSHFYDPIEIALSDRQEIKDKIIIELLEKLKNPRYFKPKPCFAFFPNKTILCHRRMIDIPLRDLVLRYAFVLILAEKLETSFINNCFANRREIEDKKELRLLQNFAETSWPNFCDWQIDMSKNYSILLKTDISSFYDSISHDYLIDIIATELGIKSNSKVLKLLHKLLRLKIYYYDPDNKLISQTMKHGLATNNSSEGFFANLYLNHIDKKIESENISYARYVDDIRIWGNDEKLILNTLYNLQKLLLAKGLNLNANKTRIAKKPKLIKELLSKKSDTNYIIFENEDVEVNPIALDGELDNHLDDFNLNFDMNKTIRNSNDAKLFCKKLNFNINRAYFIPLEQRTIVFIRKLSSIIKNFPNVGKFAAWILVHSSYEVNIPIEVKVFAKKEIIKLLSNSNINSYPKYRLLHHITRYSRLNMINFNQGEISEMIDIAKIFIKECEYELKIVSLFFLLIMKPDNFDLKEFFKTDEILKLKSYSLK